MIKYSTLEGINVPGTSIALGQFDGIHLGHQAVINKAVEGRQRGLVPAVFTFTTGNSPATAPSKKVNNKFIFSQDLKLKALDYLGVEVVFNPPFESFRGLTPEEFVRDIIIGTFHAKEISCGFNFFFGKNAAASADDLTEMAAKYGVPVHKVEGVMWKDEPVSSTRIRKCLEEGDILSANSMLGLSFMLRNEVIPGKKLGRKIQFPTINQLFHPGQLIPRYGVYATYLEFGSRRYAGVTNIGVKPTVGSDMPLAETYIIGFEGDLYGTYPVLHLLEFLRPEMKFGSVEELRMAIANDVESSKAVFKKYFG
ncbi:MAG: riboflavin biosynthesis protein RibF [Oscillospiraceae bacterium]|nr:riboflavin biosynthesis protein RibF [Oscillospiraceae bacterium]